MKISRLSFRLIVIEDVVKLEKETSQILKLILQIHIPNAKTLGNKGSSLPFISRIHLLHDLGDIDSNDVKLFTSLAEIRNQFAHNVECETFEDFSEINEGTWKFLMKQFPDDSPYGVYRKLTRKCQSILESVKKIHLNSLHYELEKTLLSDFAIRLESLFEEDNEVLFEWLEYIMDSTLEHEDKVKMVSTIVSSFATKNLLEKRKAVLKYLNVVSTDKLINLVSNRIDADKLKDYFQSLEERNIYLNYHFEDDLYLLVEKLYAEIDALDENEEIDNIHFYLYESLFPPIELGKISYYEGEGQEEE